MRKSYTFPISIDGEGDSPEEAWENAVEAFYQSPGIPEEFIENKEGPDDLVEIKIL